MRTSASAPSPFENSSDPHWSNLWVLANIKFSCFGLYLRRRGTRELSLCCSTTATSLSVRVSVVWREVSTLLIVSVIFLSVKLVRSLSTFFSTWRLKVRLERILPLLLRRYSIRRAANSTNCFRFVDEVETWGLQSWFCQCDLSTLRARRPTSCRRRRGNRSNSVEWISEKDFCRTNLSDYQTCCRQIELHRHHYKNNDKYIRSEYIIIYQNNENYF